MLQNTENLDLAAEEPITLPDPPPLAATIVSTAPGDSVACESSISSMREHRMSESDRIAYVALQKNRKREELHKYLIPVFYRHTFFVQGFYASQDVEGHYQAMWVDACAAHGYSNLPLGTSRQLVS